MYILVEQWLFSNVGSTVVATFKSKKQATRLKHRLLHKHNTHHIYKAIKYKVIKG